MLFLSLQEMADAMGKKEEASIKDWESKGTQGWTGYSFSWYSCLRARAGHAEAALKHLDIYASVFVTRNGIGITSPSKNKETTSSSPLKKETCSKQHSQNHPKFPRHQKMSPRKLKLSHPDTRPRMRPNKTSPCGGKRKQLKKSRNHMQFAFFS